MAFSLISLVVSVVILLRVSKLSDNRDDANVDRAIKTLYLRIDESISRLRVEMITATQASVKTLGDMLESNQNSRHQAMQESIESILVSTAQQHYQQLLAQEQRLDAIKSVLSSGMDTLKNDSIKQFSIIRQELDARLGVFSSENELRLENIRSTVERNLRELREDNNRRLDEMRKTVDEKLQTELERRIKESFNTVSGMLERVQKDIGSMRTLAEDVGGLKKTLSNVKTRGMMGEFQLESILSDVFSHDQFIKNAHPIPDSTNVVEFALKIPTDDGDAILLPIDSKFPGDRYSAVVEASAGDDKAALDRAINAYIAELKRAAKDIHDKYIAPPYTTDFALLFLPTESMYADAVNRNMLPEIWRAYKVYITGPSTISALLSSMQLAFNNMAIQKRAGEVFSILSEVQSEFQKFEAVLQKMQKHLNLASNDLSELMGTRSRKINNRLGSINKLSGTEIPELPVLPPINE